VTKRCWDKAKNTFVFDVVFHPVLMNSEENEKFFAATPAGQIQLATVRGDHFVPGTLYYMDLWEAAE
jgi:hypothetical protein